MCFFKCDGEKTFISPCALGTALGLIKGIWMLGLAWAGWLGGYGLGMIERIQSFHHGYGPTMMGGVIGGVSGFICAFIFGFILAWLYNVCLSCCSKKAGGKKK